MISSPQTIGFNNLSMVLGSFNHWIEWFSMVMDHWSNDAMVSMYCSPLIPYLPLWFLSFYKNYVFYYIFLFLVYAMWFSSFYAQVPTSICLLALCPIFSLGKDEAQGVSGNLPPDWSLSLYYSPELCANKNYSPKCCSSEFKAQNYWNALEWG